MKYSKENIVKMLRIIEKNATEAKKAIENGELQEEGDFTRDYFIGEASGLYTAIAMLTNEEHFKDMVNLYCNGTF